MSLRRLTADQKIASSSRKKKCLLVSKARVISYCLFPDTFRLQAFSNAFKVGAVNLANSLSPSSIVKKVRTGSKRDLSDAETESRELITPPEPFSRSTWTEDSGCITAFLAALSPVTGGSHNCYYN